VQNEYTVQQQQCVLFVSDASPAPVADDLPLQRLEPQHVRVVTGWRRQNVPSRTLPSSMFSLAAAGQFLQLILYTCTYTCSDQLAVRRWNAQLTLLTFLHVSAGHCLLYARQWPIDWNTLTDFLRDPIGTFTGCLVNLLIAQTIGLPIHQYAVVFQKRHSIAYDVFYVCWKRQRWNA